MAGLRLQVLGKQLGLGKDVVVEEDDDVGRRLCHAEVASGRQRQIASGPAP